MLIEVALGVSLLMLTLLGGLDLALAATAQHSVTWIAQKSADCTLVAGSDCVSLAYANAHGQNLQTDRLTVSVDGHTCWVSYAWKPLGPVIGPLTLRATATAQ